LTKYEIVEELDRIMKQLEALKDEVRKLREQEFEWDGWKYKLPYSPCPNQKRQCDKCGIEISGAMAYSCPVKDCPCGLGSKWAHGGLGWNGNILC
jgi:hypothetical protein